MTGMCTKIANYLIDQTNAFNNGRAYNERLLMSCKRLQKLLYFSEIIYMLNNNGAHMFDDDFYAWTSGPVIPDVYRKFEKYQKGVMLPVSLENKEPLCSKISAALDTIFEATRDINTTTLIKESHVENGPWFKVYDANDDLHRQKIDKEFTYRFYLEHPEALSFLGIN